MWRLVLCLVSALPLILLACVQQEKPKPIILEKIVTQEVLPTAVGDYSGPLGELSIKSDGTFVLNLNRLFRYNITPKGQKSSDYYVHCKLDTSGKADFVLSQKRTYLRTKITSANLVKASYEDRMGDQDLAASEVCDRVTAALINKMTDMEFSKIGDDAISLSRQGYVNESSKSGTTVFIADLSPVPSVPGYIFGRVGTTADVTSALLPALATAYSPNSNFSKNGVSAVTFSCDVATRHISFVDNVCKFQLDTTAKIVMRHDRFFIVPADAIATRTFDNENTKLFEQERIGNPQWCKDNAMISDMMKLDGLSLSITSWMAYDIRFGNQTITLFLK